jgi:hypothetical protein
VGADGGASAAGRHHSGKLAALEEDKPPGQAAVAGDPLAHIGGIKLVHDLGGEWACDSAAVRGLPPCGVKTKHGLRFYKGQLEQVHIKSKSGTMTAMINTFQAQFGPGAQANQYIPNYLWEGPNTIIFLDCSEATLSCEGIIASVRVRAEKKADSAVAARGAKQDF